MKKVFIKTTILVLVLFNLTYCFSQSNTKSLIDNLENYIEDKQIPGAMITIVRSDTILFSGGIGFADIEKNESVSAQHLFRQGSISKSFTALGLYKLVNKSSYTLNSTLREIDKTLPFSNEWENKFPVRVSHILEHTSGFEDFHLHAMYNVKDTVLLPILNMVNDHRQSLESRWKPGTKKAYSNPNYILAGHLIEVLSGSAYNDYIFKNVLTPIEMHSSGYYFKEPKNVLFAQGYQRAGTTLTPIPFASINGGPAGDFCSNAEDMASYLQFMLKKDTILFSEKEFDRIEIPQTSIAAQNGLQAGYGLGNYSIWKNGYLFHGHGGEIDGFASRYMYSRDADLGIAVSINRNGNANEMVDEILNSLLGKQKNASANRVTYPIPETLKEKFSGFYEFKSPKSELTSFTDRMLAGLQLDFKKDKIIAKTMLGRPKYTLWYAGNNQFYVADEGVPSAMLIASDVAKEVFWINDNYTEKESRTKRAFLFFGLLISVLFIASFLIYTIFWYFFYLYKKKKSATTNHFVLFGAIIAMILLFIGFGLTVANVQNSGGINFYSLLTFVSSYVLVVLSLASIWRWFKLPNKSGFRVYYILTSISAIAVSIYLWNIGFVGLKLWSY